MISKFHIFMEYSLQLTCSILILFYAIYETGPKWRKVAITIGIIAVLNAVGMILFVGYLWFAENWDFVSAFWSAVSWY